MKQSMFMKIYILPMILISPIFTISCNSWFSIWMTMELNLMTFIPMLIFFNKFYKNLALKYFIIQALGSSIFILTSNIIFTKFFLNFSNLIILLNLSLLLKLGAAPFHNWFINMMKNLNWLNCMILSTWQKTIPLLVLMHLINKYLIYMNILISATIGALFSLNHQSIRLIMSYSSINHISWMLINMINSENMWMMYFISYSILNISIMSIFHNMKIFFLSQMFTINNLMIKFYLILNFLSISGLPPLFGFSMKWLTLYFSNFNNNYLIIIYLITLTIFSFIFYTRITLSLFMNLNIKNKLILVNKFTNLNNMSMNFFLPISFIFNLWMMSIWLF